MIWFIRDVLEKIKKTLPERIKGLYVFGSRIRGDHDEWSDLDVLIMVKDKNIKLEKAIIDRSVEERFATGIPFAPVIKDIRVFENERALISKAEARRYQIPRGANCCLLN